MRKIILAIAAVLLLVSGFIIWWFYGSGLSEETALKLASDYAQDYAKRNRLDLSLYSPPTVSGQKNRRLYTFSWIPKQGAGKPLTVVVDTQNVEVTAIDTPDKSEAAGKK